MRRFHCAAAALLALPLNGLAAPPTSAADTVTASPNMKAVGRLKYQGGTDLEITKIKGRRYVVAGAQNNYNPTDSPGLRVVDVTNPARPKQVGYLPCNSSQNDIQVRGTYAFLAVDFNARADVNDRSDCFSQLRDVVPGTGVVIVDLRNPARPKPVSFVRIKTGAHNATVHPTKPFLYVSESESLSGDAYASGKSPIHIVNWANPAKPVLLPPADIAPVDSAHDITFNAKGTRAYVAAGFGGFVAVLDTTDPAKPTVLSRFADAAINFSHQADPTPDGKYLLVSDELAGASGNMYCPGGGVHVWDISTDTRPAKVGAYFIPDTFPSNDPGPRPVIAGQTLFRCTAHVMKVAPDSKTLVMAWYSQGIQVLDLTGLPGVSVGAQGRDAGVGIKRLGNWKVAGGDAWSAKMDDRGYIYTGDTQRGMDVVRYTKPAPGAELTSPGEWLTPAQALARAVRDRATQPERSYFCYEPLTRLGL